MTEQASRPLADPSDLRKRVLGGALGPAPFYPPNHHLPAIMMSVTRGTSCIPDRWANLISPSRQVVARLE